MTLKDPESNLNSKIRFDHLLLIRASYTFMERQTDQLITNCSVTGQSLHVRQTPSNIRKMQGQVMKHTIDAALAQIHNNF